jgi:hypothetical protein
VGPYSSESSLNSSVALEDFSKTYATITRWCTLAVLNATLRLLSGPDPLRDRFAVSCEKEDFGSSGISGANDVAWVGPIAPAGVHRALLLSVDPWFSHCPWVHKSVGH